MAEKELRTVELIEILKGIVMQDTDDVEETQLTEG